MFYNFLEGFNVPTGYYEYGILGCIATESEVSDEHITYIFKVED
jgi:hypothetical protein